MAKNVTGTDRRAQHIAAFGFALQFAACVGLTGLAIWKGSDAVAALARFVGAGIAIWIILYLVFQQTARVAAERLETAELKRAQESGTGDAIFEVDDETLLLEQNRLRWMIRFLLPSVTVLIASILLIGHFIGWGWTPGEAFAVGGFSRSADPTLLMWFVVGIGFLCFLFARWSIALSRLPNFRLLRAGAVYMASIAVACLLLAIALMATESFTWAEPLLGYIVRVSMVVLGIELVANFVLDFYRPRNEGAFARPSFDSRLLGLIGEPGGFAKSIADTINYQFGFEVSSTWFYQLLQRCLFPLTVVTLVIILLMSTIVVVNADEEAIVERWGQPLGDPPMPLAPGIHLKMPFPMDIVQRAPVRRVRELVIGEARQKEDQPDKGAVLWTEAHEFVPELLLLVASEPNGVPADGPSEGPGHAWAATDSGSTGEAVPVSLLNVSVPIEYRVKDIRRFLYTYADPEKIMEQVAYQFLSEYAASVDIDTLMGPGRTELNRHLRPRLQERLDALESGIEVVFAGIRGAHPPAKDQVAEAFLEVITAQTTRAATINAAEGEATKILTRVAGTDTRARALDAAILGFRRLEADSSATLEKVAEAKALVADLLNGNPFKGISRPSGEAAKRIAEARAAASLRVADASAKVRAFAAEAAAYEAAPSLYVQRKLLEPYEAIGNVRKFMVVGDPHTVIVEYETERQIGLDRVLQEPME